MSEIKTWRKLEYNMLNRLHVFSGIKQEEIKDIFMSLVYEMILDYRNGHPSVIPNLGEIKFVYTGDSLREDGLVDANIKVEVSLCQDMIRSIGQIVDGEESDIEKKLMNRMRNILSEKLDIVED